MSAIRSTLPALGLLAALLPLAPQSAGAQSASAQREIEAARDRVRALRQQAEELQSRIASAGQPLAPGQGRETGEILQGLRQGMAALRALGAMDALDQLERITAAVEQRAERGARDNQPGLSEAEIEVMRLAVRSLAGAERIEAAEILERAIAAGTGSREARTDRERPSRGNQIEALMLAERVLREAGRLDAADMVGRYARRLTGPTNLARATDRPSESNEVQVARRQLEVMRMGLEALAESNAIDAREILEQAMHVRELALAGQPYQGERPSRGAQAEVLMLAAEILGDRGRPERAQAVAAYARELADQARRLRDAPRQEPGRQENGPGDRVERLEARLEELTRALQDLQTAVQQLRRDRD